MGNENGKWQIAFWITTGFIVLIITLLIPQLVQMDRLRASEDCRIEQEIQEYNKVLNKMAFDIGLIKGKLGIP